MLTTSMLPEKWKELGIEVGGHMEPMTKKFSECLGVEDGVAIFIIDGMDRSLPQSRCSLAVGDNGFSCIDYGVSARPFSVGYFIELDAQVQ